MALIPKPQFPNVPNLPGVPQVQRSRIFPSAPPPLLGIPALAQNLWEAVHSPDAWGIFEENTDTKKLVRVLAPDSVLDFAYRNEYKVPNFPVQDGSFASYNKVANPYEIMVRFSKAGTLSERAVFLENLELINASLRLLVVVTPERVYRNVNMVRFEVVRRGGNGAYFLTDVDVAFQQIREVAPQYTTSSAATVDAKNPSAKPATNQGKVQPAVPPAGASFDPATSVGVQP